MYNYYLFPGQSGFSGANLPTEPTNNSIPSQGQINAQKDYQRLLEKYTRLKEKFEDIKQENKRLKDYINELQQLFKPEMKKKKVRRRMESQLQKQHRCPYSACKKEYASNLALNLHIRNKHDGGTKKDRIAFIKLVLDARSKGQEPPSTKWNIPQEVIEYQIRLFNQKLESQHAPQGALGESSQSRGRFPEGSLSIQEEIVQ